MPSLGLAQETPQFSGFLSDYSRLAPDPEEPDARLEWARDLAERIAEKRKAGGGMP